MKKAAISVAVLFLFSNAAFAANWYVRKGAAGSNNGTDWTNAWTDFSSINFASVACGDTVWIATGAYTTTLSVGKTCTGGTILTIQRALTTDSVPIAAAGWNNSFDGQVTGPSPWTVTSGAFITIDGRTTTGRNASNGTGGTYGIQLTVPAGGGNGMFCCGSGNVDHLTVNHVELVGPACASAGTCSTGAYGFNFPPGSNIFSNGLIANSSAHHMSETVRESNWRDTIVERNSFHDMFNDGVDHEDVVYDFTFAAGGGTPCNVTWRYNYIYNSPNDGIFFEFGGAANFCLYRNVFYASNVGFGTFKAPGTYGPIRMINNTFQSANGPCSSNCSFYQTNGSTMTDCVVENNVFYYVSNSMDGCTMDHNAYNYSSLGGFGWPSGETGAFNTVTSATFNSVAGGDFHEVSGAITRNAGATETSTFNTDMDGNVATAGSTDVGAFQFSSGTPQAASPSFSPGSGTYVGAQSVTITSSSGAIICYNTTGSPATNGTTGCTTGTLYAGPVTVSVNSTLFAVAGGTGFTDSTVASANYTFTVAQQNGAGTGLTAISH